MIYEGIPWGGEHGHGRGGGVQLGVMHMTYGQWGGDVATVANNGLATFVVGKDQGQWIQLADSESVTYNCGNWNANNHSVAIEFTGVNDDTLTEWQCQAGGHIVKLTQQYHGVPITYDGRDGGFANPPWSGWYAHRTVAADNPPQHYDFIDDSEWQRIAAYAGGAGPVASPGGLNLKGSNMLIVGTKDGKWHAVHEDGGATEADGGFAFALGISGVPVLKDQEPLALIGIQLTLAKAAKDSAALAKKLG